MDYGKEAESLKESNWFKPKEGTTKVKFTGEMGEPSEKTFGEGENARTVKQVVIPVEVNGEQLDWSVTVSEGKYSLYGQIVRFAAKNGNTLSGKEVTLIRKGTSTGTDYTIVEVADE